MYDVLFKAVRAFSKLGQNKKHVVEFVGKTSFDIPDDHLESIIQKNGLTNISEQRM